MLESFLALYVYPHFLFSRFGSHSVEVGHELVKYTDVLLGDLQDTSRRISQFEEKLLEARTCLERAAEIFALHYGKWHSIYQEIKQKLEKTQFLVRNEEDSLDPGFSG